MADEMDWEDLQRAWQQPSEDRLPELEKLLRRRSRMIWILTGLDVLFTLFVLGWGGWLVANNPTGPMIGFAASLVFMLIFGWWLMLWIRRGTWRADTAAPSAMVDLSIRRCRASIQLALVNQWSLASGFIIAFTLRTAGFRAPDIGLEVDWWLRAIVLVLGCAWFVAATVYKKRKRDELAALIDLKEHLEQQDSSA